MSLEISAYAHLMTLRLHCNAIRMFPYFIFDDVLGFLMWGGLGCQLMSRTSLCHPTVWHSTAENMKSVSGEKLIMWLMAMRASSLWCLVKGLPSPLYISEMLCIQSRCFGTIGALFSFFCGEALHVCFIMVFRSVLFSRMSRVGKPVERRRRLWLVKAEGEHLYRVSW